MKDIIFVSSVYNHIHSENSCMSFKSYIDRKNLAYLPQTAIEVGVKYITLTIPALLLDPSSPQVFALKSDISSVPVIRNNIYDTILCTFSIRDAFVSKDDKSISIYFKRPLFFLTTIENLCQASFQLINATSNEELKHVYSQPSFNSTVICMCVKQRTMTEQQPFNMLLQSENPMSKMLYEDNNNMKFRIHLPKRLDLNKKWSVTLKSLHITNKIDNIQQSGDYWFQYNYEKYEKGKRSTTNLVESPQFNLPVGYYATEVEIFKILNKICHQNENLIKLFLIAKGGKKYFVLQLVQLEDYNQDLVIKCKVKMSPTLAKLMGFTKEISDEIKEINLRGNKHRYFGEFPIDLWSGQPRQICIQCDIVEKMLVGSKLMRNLRCINIFEEMNNQVMSFSFDQNDFSRVEMKSFDSLEIKITDMNGEIITSDNQFINIETIVQLMFVNI